MTTTCRGHLFMEKTKITRSIAETGLLIALSIVLSFIQIPFVFGAQITLASTLPIFIICFREKKGWAFLSAFLFSGIQLAIGIVRDGLLGFGLISTALFGCIALDYIAAFTSIGIASFFENNKEKGMIFGIFLAFFVRYICHVLSGYLIFSNLEQWSLFGKVFENKALLYSICFNALHLVPEYIITTIGFVAVIRIPYLKEKIFIKK